MRDNRRCSTNPRVGGSNPSGRATRTLSEHPCRVPGVGPRHLEHGEDRVAALDLDLVDRRCCICCERARRRQTVATSTRRPRPPAIARPAFAGFCFPPDVIMLAVRWYLRFALSYRDVEELLAERGVEVDHTTIYRWVQRFTPLLADAARPCGHAVGGRWPVALHLPCHRSVRPGHRRVRLPASRRERRPGGCSSGPSARRRLSRWRWSPTRRRRTRRCWTSWSRQPGIASSRTPTTASRPTTAG
jgi:hypothetical protein